MPSPPVPPPMRMLNRACSPALATGCVYTTAPAWFAVAVVRVVAEPDIRADLLYDQPPPGGGTATAPDPIDTPDTECTSSRPPVPPVKAASTVDGRLTATDRYRTPSTVTEIFPPETVTPMTC